MSGCLTDGGLADAGAVTDSGRGLWLGAALGLLLLLGLLFADQAFAFGLPADPVGLGILDAGGVALDTDAKRDAEIECLFVGEPKLFRELMDPDLLRRQAVPQPFVCGASVAERVAPDRLSSHVWDLSVDENGFLLVIGTIRISTGAECADCGGFGLVDRCAKRTPERPSFHGRRETHRVGKITQPTHPGASTR